MIDEISQRNKALLRRFYQEVYADWNMARVDAVVAPQFTSHDWPQDGATGPRAFRAYYAALRAAVPDARYQVDDLVAEGDRVVVRWTMRGTHAGASGRIAASGQAIALAGITIYRVQGGQLVERWVVSDLHGVLEQIRQGRDAQTANRGAGLDLTGTYLHLATDGGATALAVDDDFWTRIEASGVLHEGRLMGAFHVESDPSHWEVHPAGDEILCLLSGSMDVVLREAGGERVVPLRDRGTCVVPRGVWHRQTVHAPSEFVFITPGAGTRTRAA